MAANTTSAAHAGPVSRDFLILLLSLLVILGALFHRSFRPEEVVFSNDGPLGAVAAQAGFAWKNLLGYWQDLNWLGGKQPAGFLAIGYAIFALVGPLLYAKFIAPISLLFLGLSAWLLFRQLGFSPPTSFQSVAGACRDGPSRGPACFWLWRRCRSQRSDMFGPGQFWVVWPSVWD
ncbi:MAG: hypothetical protein DME19_07090 [Verrucomicrobia bacterium]|nr:MAG: hypothetical protein DME19_07090 [Verrucomicrobiota bacterium]